MKAVKEEEQQGGTVYDRLKRLRTPSDARQYCQALIDAVDKNRVTEKKARCIGYLLKIFLDCYQLSDLEKQVEELQELVKDED